jgi:hypothetical protein
LAAFSFAKIKYKFIFCYVTSGTAMKKIITIFLFLICNGHMYAQYDSLLSKENENTVFAFQLENKKWVSVSKEKSGKYLVYRFGNKDKIELQIPTVLDTSSWSRFKFSGYNRGGGRENAAMFFGYLSFGTKGIGYEVYQLWNSEDSVEHCGLYVIAKGKLTDMKGNVESKKGNLINLLYEGKIKQDEEEQ